MRFDVIPMPRAALLLMLIIAALSPAHNATTRAAIEPHLGYGVHFAPNTNVDPGLVSQLGMDWVKIYDTGDAAKFPGKRILYRMELKWPNDWNQFKADVAGVARGLIGSPITAVEAGNEPNLVNEWILKPNAWQYTQMLRVVYTTIKAVNPEMIVISAGLAPTITTPGRDAVSDLDFAREMLDNGAAEWMDAFGYHPYGYNQPPEVAPTVATLVFRRTELIRKLMEERGISKQIWLTEFGWLRNPAEDGATCSDSDPDFAGFAWLRVSGEQQADYLVRAFRYAHENWLWAGPMFVWNLNWNRLAGMAACSHMRWFSLLRSDGSPTLAFQRLQAMPHYTSEYLPHLELHSDAMTANVSMACLKRVPLGTFTIRNSGYPSPGKLRIEPAPNPDPPYAEAAPASVRVDEPVTIFVNPVGVKEPGQYVVHINVKGDFGGRVISQHIQGYVVVGMGDVDCL